MPPSKTIEIDREKIITILTKILELPLGSEIFIPCASKKSQLDSHTCLVRELRVLSEISPSDAAEISHRAIFKDKRFWLVLTHIEPTLNCVYVKSGGKLTKEII